MPKISFEEFRKNPPKSLKVYDPGRRENIILDYLPEEGQYITRKNMGTRRVQVYHCWSIENAYKQWVVNK
ncbi:hypothetical protein GCM10010965_14280 [Caldalkalibacillus thermarum]|uniref:hypothetical protein n=1 Tax=Caldalkalibacillus thermarum TaxID=296745 RepID=UPI0016692CAC|nr:hypothetical protein [Caldalkalibacillus thermarum]GGK22512.1 hypothetical protein GCM10010965_14280 [Caldalkalibacillus thermarum]